MHQHFTVPFEVKNIAKTLENGGFEAYLVGGCVRDLILEKTPKDWDITTNATPEQIQELFEDSFYNNDYGTVGVVNDNTPDETLRIIEITPYRLETTYSNARHPDSVEFGTSLEEDLKRRDFTMNAIAYSVSHENIVDPYMGQEDIKHKLVRAVGDPKERFTEDALRMLRAVRLATQLHFSIEEGTRKALKDIKDNLQNVSIERIRDEFSKILMTDQPMSGIILSRETGLLEYVVPDLERGVGVEQNGIHIYDVFEHLLRTMQHAADKNWPFDVRLAGLLHDISKPETRRWSEKTNDYTFYGHEVVGARVTKKVLNDLKFPKKQVEKISKLVRWHMFFSDPDKITLSAVRRVIRNVGEENIWELLNLRICDRIGSGRPKEQPFRFRKYKAMVEQALRDPLSVTMLKIDGKQLMDVTREKAGPRIGWILHALLEEVLDDAGKNTEEWLQKRAQELSELPDGELRTIGTKGQQRLGEEESAAVEQIHKKYWVS